MNKLFARLCEENTPRVNSPVMDGLAVTYMRHAEEYIDKVFRSASKSFPEGLKYLGYERCTPEEEYLESTKIKNNKRSFDLAKSDLYLVKYSFSYMDQPIPNRYIYLPFVNDGAILSLGGSRFAITPVISDKVISPGFDNLFVRLLRDKIIFKRTYHAVVINGKRETNHVIWSQIYRKNRSGKKPAATTKANTAIAHYLFAKHGFSAVFQKYCGFVPIVGTTEITPENYPEDQWIICESTKVKPKTFIGDFYTASEMKLAVPKDQWNNITKGLVVGFFYVVDHFPNRLLPTYLDSINTWMILLGHIVFSGHFGENKLYQNILEHFISLDDYIDTIVTEKLKECNYEVNDFYDLLVLVISEFNSMVLDNTNSANSMYGKNLEVLYYVLYDITASIFKVNFRLGKLASKKNPLTMNDVIETFNRNVKPGAIFGLASGKIITESVSYSGDHKYFKITSKITEQESLPGATRGKGKRLSVGVDKHLDISMVEAGSVLFLSKSNPSPTNRINPFVELDITTGTILPNGKFTELRNRTQSALKGMANSHIDLLEDEDDGITISDE